MARPRSDGRPGVSAHLLTVWFTPPAGRPSPTIFAVDTAAGFDIDTSADVSVVRLDPSDAHVLQRLYEACSDFSLLVDGEGPAPTAAAEDLSVVPPGSAPEDKHVFGLVEPGGRIVGMIESIRGFPDADTWWLGLLMIDPSLRRGGLGAAFTSGFERWVSGQEFHRIELGVVGANSEGYAFWERQGFRRSRTVGPQTFGRLTHDVHVMGKTID